MWFIQGVVSLTGRVCFCAIFLLSAVANKIPRFQNVANDMRERGIPGARWMLVGAITILLIGSILVIAGYRARLGAALLLVFLGLATYYYHGFWRWPSDSPERTREMIHFLKNLGLAGMALFLLANGPGAWTISHECRTDDRDFV
jgi:putative oxidoreductase